MCYLTEATSLYSRACSLDPKVGCGEAQLYERIGDASRLANLKTFDVRAKPSRYRGVDDAIEGSMRSQLEYQSLLASGGRPPDAYYVVQLGETHPAAFEEFEVDVAVSVHRTSLESPAIWTSATKAGLSKNGWRYPSLQLYNSVAGDALAPLLNALPKSGCRAESIRRTDFSSPAAPQSVTPAKAKSDPVARSTSPAVGTAPGEMGLRSQAIALAPCEGVRLLDPTVSGGRAERQTLDLHRYLKEQCGK